MASLPVVTTDFYDTAPIHFSVSRTVPATPDQVFAALADTPTWPRWFTSISVAEWTSEAPYGVGSTRRVKTGPIWINEQFIVWEPGSRWGFSFTKTTIALVKAGAELVELVLDGTGTKVTYNIYLQPLRAMRGVTRLMRRGVEMGLAAGLKGLGEHLSSTSV